MKLPFGFQIGRSQRKKVRLSDTGRQYYDAAANVTGKGKLDLTKSDAARTITTLKVGAGGKANYDPGVVTLTNKIQPVETAGMLQISVAAA